MLIGGGELLVRGASLLALSMRISPLVIGLTVVAFGTSAPELGVSLQAAMSGAADVAIGNVVGSNICNVLLILGMASLAAPLVVSSQLIRVDVPLMVGFSLLLWWFCSDLTLSRLEGAVLFASLLLYIFLSVVKSRKESFAITQEFSSEMPEPSGLASTRAGQVGLFVVGLILLGLGSNWLVAGAVTIAKMWGVSKLIIGLTVVAIGTSLPEVVTSVVASLRGQRDIAVGNVVGSNLFNILCVLGLTATVAPGGIPIAPPALSFDIPVMVAVAAICLPIFFAGSVITRTEGALLLFYYLCYNTLIISAQTNPELNSKLSFLLAAVVLPITIATVLGSAVWSWHVAKRRKV